MEADILARIRSNPDFVELEKTRNAFSWSLCSLMLVIYFGFIFLVAFLPKVMAINVGGVVTLGFPLGLAVMASAIAITGIYVLRANGEYDRLTRRIVENVS